MIKLLTPILVFGSVMAAGCEMSNPCATLPPPNAQEIAVSRSGAEVERELNNGTECDLINGQWAPERD